MGRSDSENPWITVIGVVQTFEMIRPLQFGSAPPEGMFVPIIQEPAQGFSILLKTDGGSTGLATPLRRVIRTGRSGCSYGSNRNRRRRS